MSHLEDPVFVQDFAAQSQKWIPGVVLEKKASLLFFVQLPNGRIVCKMGMLTIYRIIFCVDGDFNHLSQPMQHVSVL